MEKCPHNSFLRLLSSHFSIIKTTYIDTDVTVMYVSLSFVA